MAQKAKKDRARANTTALNNLHIGSAVVNGIFLALHFFVRSRSLLTYGLVSIPAIACQFILETSGRPKYDAKGALKTAGEDMASPGLTEYMFDVVWVTWAGAALTLLFGNKGWLLLIAIPAYGFYMASSLLGFGRQKLAQMQDPGQQAAAPQGNRKARRAA